MILISKENEAEIDFKHDISMYSVIFADFLDNKKKIRKELVNAIFSSNYFLYKKKIYVFQNSYLISESLIKFLFKEYYEIDDNKDIYLLNIGKNERNIKKYYKGKFRYYKCKVPLDSYEDNFFSDLKKVITLDKNRNKLINYNKLIPPFPYILDIIGFNISRDYRSLDKLIENMEILVNIRKYYKLKNFNKKILHSMMNVCYSPLHIRKLDFPIKHKIESKEEEKEEKVVSIEELSEYVSEEFLEKFSEKAITAVRTKRSMF